MRGFFLLYGMAPAAPFRLLLFGRAARLPSFLPPRFTGNTSNGSFQVARLYSFLPSLGKNTAGAHAVAQNPSVIRFFSRRSIGSRLTRQLLAARPMRSVKEFIWRDDKICCEPHAIYWPCANESARGGPRAQELPKGKE